MPTKRSFDIEEPSKDDEEKLRSKTFFVEIFICVAKHFQHPLVDKIEVSMKLCKLKVNEFLILESTPKILLVHHSTPNNTNFSNPFFRHALLQRKVCIIICSVAPALTLGLLIF